MFFLIQLKLCWQQVLGHKYKYKYRAEQVYCRRFEAASKMLTSGRQPVNVMNNNADETVYKHPGIQDNRSTQI